MRIQGYPIIYIILFTIGCSLSVHSQVTVVEMPKQVDVTDTANSPIIIANTRITGYKRTKLYIIEREIPFKTGEYIPRQELAKKLQLCKQQLMNTSLFVDVDVSIARQEKELVFIDVRVKERWYLFPLPYFKLIDRNINQWWVEQKRSLDRVNYGIKFMQNNVSGRNDNLNIWLIGGYTQQVSFRYENPFLDKSLKHGMNVGFSYSGNRELAYLTTLNKQKFLVDNDEYAIKSLHVDMAYSYRPAIKTRHHFRLSYTDQSISNKVMNSNPSFFGDSATNAKFADFNYNLQYFNVDYIPYPTKGFMGDAYFYKRVGIGSKNSIWQVGVRGDYSITVLPKSYVQLQGAGIVRVPFNQPYNNERLFGGGDFYLRGLEYYVIDGAAGGFGRVTAKKEVLSFNVKNYLLRSKTHDKIPFRIVPKIYGDMGYAYSRNPGRSLLNDKLLYTWGGGIDVVTFYDVVMKFEYSFNQLGERGFFFHTKADF